MSERSTISAEYRAQQQELHKNPEYGVASLSFAPTVKTLMEQFGVKSISDYGAGKCNLRRALHELGKTDFDYFPYDPAFPEYGDPRPADIVCCIDVLEHIEDPFLDAVLLDLKDITRNIGVFVHSYRTGSKAVVGRAQCAPDSKTVILVASEAVPALRDRSPSGLARRLLGHG